MHQLLYWKFEHLFTNDAVKLYKLITIFRLSVHIHNIFIEKKVSQVGFAEFDNTADNRANIGGTIIGAPIVGQ